MSCALWLILGRFRAASTSNVTGDCKELKGFLPFVRALCVRLSTTDNARLQSSTDMFSKVEVEGRAFCNWEKSCDLLWVFVYLTCSIFGSLSCRYRSLSWGSLGDTISELCGFDLDGVIILRLAGTLTSFPSGPAASHASDCVVDCVDLSYLCSHVEACGIGRRYNRAAV